MPDPQRLTVPRDQPSPTRSVPARGIEHPNRLRDQARNMGRAGWTPTQIARIFAQQGENPVPSPSVIKWWLKGSKDAERQMEHQRRNKARKQAKESGGRFLGGPPRSAEFRMARMQGLRATGMPCEGIARVMTFDFPNEPVTAEQVRYALKNGVVPRPYRPFGGPVGEHGKAA